MFPFGIASRGSFKRQTILTFVVGFFVLISAFSVYQIKSNTDHEYRDSEEVAIGLAQALAVNSQSWVLTDDVVGLQEVVHSLLSYPEMRYAMILTPAGRVLAHSDKSRVGQFVTDEQSLALIKTTPGNRVITDTTSIIDLAVPIRVGERHIGWARLAMGREAIARNLRMMILSSALFVLFATSLSLLAALLIANRFGSRIGRLVKVADAVQSGNFSERAYIPEAGDEINRLADSLNLMLDEMARNEARLRAASHYTRSLIEVSLDPLVTIDPEGKITDVNKATEAATGRDRDALIGTDFSDYFTEPDKARAGYRQVFETGFVTDYPLHIKHQDGGIADVLYNASIFRNEADEVQGIFAAARDVTELNKAELEARQLALQNRLVLESAGEGIYGLDTGGRCTFANPAAAKLLGFSVEEMLGQHAHHLFHHTRPDGRPYPEGECPVQTAYRQGEVHRGSDLYWRKDGSSFPVDFVSTPIMSEGNITGAVVLFNDITERRQAEEELRRSRESLNEAQRIAHLGSWHMDLATNEVVWSEVLYQMYGFDPALPPPPYTESMKLFTTESWERLSTAIARAIETGIPYELELEMVPKEGGNKWMLARGELVRDTGGKPVRVRGVVMDITERKLAEVKIRESEKKFKALTETSPLAIYMSSGIEQKAEYINPRFTQLFGYTLEEVPTVEQWWPRAYPDEQYRKHITEEWQRKVEHAISTNSEIEPMEVVVTCKDGSKKNIQWGYISTGIQNWAFGLDLTERKQAEEELRRSEQGLAEAQRMAHLGNWELDLVSNELIWSDEIYRIFEIDKDKFAATYEAFLNAIHPEDRDRVNNAYTESLKNRKPYDIEHRLQMPDGRIKYVNEKCETYFGEDGKPLRSIGTVHDITERKRVEDELRRYKDHLEEEIQQRTADLVLARNAADTANRAKSVFLANMSHELRTPLNAILGFSSLMSKDPLLQPEQHENLDIINRSGEHLLVLINDVLEMSKIEAGRVELENLPFDLGGMVRDVSDMMHVRAKEKGLQLLVEQSSKVPRYINGDEARLRQVLINLVGNAVKFTQQGGVTLRFGVKPDAEQQHLLIEVEDSGIGIKPEDQQRIFEPFVQLGEDATQKGTGLGLPLARQYVQLMGGEIVVESTPGKGSVFRVELPMEIAEDAVVSRQKGNVPQDVTGLAPGQPEYRIMIAEDQRENQLLLERLMANIGIQARVAENGAQAVELFQSWRPHLIWMDRRMPVMDGIEATRRIRELPGGKEVTIVAVTASAFTEQRDEMLKVGMNDFVRKPYRFNEIYECMGKQLGIKYTYVNQGVAEPANEVQLTAEMLAVLPVALRDELRAALESLESERISTVIRQVSAYDSVLTTTLSHIAENFDYPAILKALQNQSTGKVT